MKRVLVTNLIMQRDAHQFADRLQAAGIELEHYPVRQFLSEAELLPILSQYDGMIAGDDQITRRVLAAALPRLKVISKWGVGLDSIDLAAARDLGVPVFNSPGAFGEAVGEVTAGYLVMLARHLGRVDRAVRAGSWIKPEGTGLMGRTCGVLGFGAIGQAIGRRAVALGMTLHFTDPRTDIANLPPAARQVDLDTLLAESDYVCLACNLTAENRHLIDASRLARMKVGAHLVNVARGPLVDEAALIDALERGHLAGAALDVFEEEPLSADHPFCQMEQVVLGTHNANNLASANQFVNENSLRNLLSILAPDA